VNVSPLAEEEEEETTVVLAEDIVVETIDATAASSVELASTTTAVPPEEIGVDHAELPCPSRLESSHSIDDMATMYYSLVPPQPAGADNGILCVRIEDEGTDPYNWMGFGVSSSPYAVANSEAVIGVPLNEGDNAVLKYDVEDDDIGALVAPMRKRKQTLRDASIDMVNDPATGEYLLSELSFAKFIDETGETNIEPQGTSFFYYARGRSTEIGEHYPIIMFEVEFDVEVATTTTVAPTTTDPPLVLVDSDPEIAGIVVDGEVETAPVVDVEAETAPVVDVEAETAPETIELDEEEELLTSTPAVTEEEEPPTDGRILITKVLEPDADTWIENALPDANFGIRQRLKVDQSPVRATLLRFDTSPLSDFLSRYQPVEAQLWIYSLTGTPYGGSIEVLENCTDWDESELTWNNAPSCALILSSDSAGTLGENVEAQSWNRAAVGLDLANLPGLITLRITSDNPDGVTYASRENATAVPKLVVSFLDGDEPTISPSTVSAV